MRDLDIKIAHLLGHYKETISDTSKRGWYNSKYGEGVNGGSLAMSIFKKPIDVKFRFDEDGNRRWWQSESNSEMWYTSAVPCYNSNLIDAFKLFDYLPKNIKWVLEKYISGDKYSCAIIDFSKINNHIFYESPWCNTKEEAICKSFLKYLEG